MEGAAAKLEHLSMDKVENQAFVSLTTNDDYADGAMVLGASLLRGKTKRKLILMVTKGVSQNKRDQLSTVWDELVEVQELNSEDEVNLRLIARPELGVTFTKLKIWTLTQFEKCVFLDADTLVLQNVDELFEREELSAAPDIGWPDCFNSGVFVFTPSMETYHSLLKFATEQGSFDGGDQGLLNMYFREWATKDISYHLPFLYNMVSNVCYTYAPAYKQFGKDAKIVHFLGSVKPWHHSLDQDSSTVVLSDSMQSSGSDSHFIQLWWDVYKATDPEFIASADQDQTNQKSTKSAQAICNLPVVSKAVGEMEHKASWERGIIDYEGEDGFENIQQHMEDILKSSPKNDDLHS